MTPLSLLIVVACADHPQLAFNEPPAAPVVVLSPANPTTLDNIVGTLSPEASDPEDDELTIAWLWFRNGQEWAISGPIAPAEQTMRGDTWRAEVSVSDGEWTATGSAEVEVLNSAPVAEALTLSPEAPTTQDDLVATASGSDADEDYVEFDFRWWRDGEEQTAFAGDSTVPASYTASGEVWKVVATPTDGDVAGTAIDASIRIDNAPPSITSVSLFPAAPLADDALAANANGLSDPDGDAVSISFSWYVDGAELLVDEPAGSISYYTEPLVRGQELWVVATPSDGFTTGASVTSARATVGNTPPSVESATVSPNPAYKSSTLSCVTGGDSDIDGDDVDFDVEWFKGGVSISTGATLSGSSFARGDSITCTATPNDGTDAGASVTSEAVVISNSLPTISSVSTSPASVTAATGISATYSGWSDADGDGAAVTYTWNVNGVAAGSSSSLAASWLDRGDTVYASVTPYDSYGSGAAVNSAVVTVENAPPTISNVNLSPSPAYTNTDLSATTSGFYDADGDAASYSYAWTINGAADATTSSALSSSLFKRGDRVLATVTPSDGYASGSPVSSSTVTISNSPPDAVASDDGGTFEECDVVTLDGSASSDQDGDSLTYTWSVNSVPSASRRGTSSLTSTSGSSTSLVVDAEGNFKIALVVSDGGVSDTTLHTVAVTARADNESPVADAGDDQSFDASAACSSSGYTTACVPCDAQTFTLDASGSTDPDGDPLTFGWAYTADGRVAVAGASTAAPTVTFSGVATTLGSTTTVSFPIVMTAYDCAGGKSTDTVTIEYTCTGS